MRVKAVDFEVTYIDLRNKPEWFLDISPHGKVPVLQVDEQPLFESNAIAEYLDEVVTPQLHPEDAIVRARHRAWTDYVPTFASGLSVYYAKSEAAVSERLPEARQRLGKITEALQMDAEPGPYFGGNELCLVDAAYAPFLQRFMLVDQWLNTNLMDEFPLVRDWTAALLSDERVIGSVPDNFTDEFIGNLRRRGLWVAELIPQEVSAG
jgi:glutathione S-transferase